MVGWFISLFARKACDTSYYSSSSPSSTIASDRSDCCCRLACCCRYRSSDGETRRFPSDPAEPGVLPLGVNPPAVEGVPTWERSVETGDGAYVLIDCAGPMGPL